MPADSLWQAVLGEVELSVSRGNFVTWFKHTSLIRNDQEVVIVGVPNVFIKQQLERKYVELLRDMLAKNDVHPREIIFKIQSAPVARHVEDEPVFQANTEVVAAILPQQTITPPPRNSLSHTYRQGLNERYTFDTFIVGSGSELAFAACQSIVQVPGTKYNPLFLYGGVGIGKTHLMQAVGNAILAKNPRARVLYISTEQFVQEFVDAIRFKKTAEFASHYRTADVLIIDDVQFIAGKEKMQEEFFHTFNALHQANKQIIISSDRPPRDIPTLEERLRSRFAWGMTIDMQNPDFETRCAILQAKAHIHGVSLPSDVSDYLSTNIPTNVRELEGALNQLLAFCEMRGLEPSLSVVSGLISVSKSRPKHLSAKQVIERTAKHFQIPLEDMLGPKRDKDIVVPRQVAMYMLRSELHLSFPKIAHELGRKDHTTAIHSVEKIEKEVHVSDEIREAVASIKERLYA